MRWMDKYMHVERKTDHFNEATYILIKIQFYCGIENSNNPTMNSFKNTKKEEEKERTLLVLTSSVPKKERKTFPRVVFAESRLKASKPHTGS